MMSEPNIPLILHELISIDSGLHGKKETERFYKHALRWIPEEERQAFRELEGTAKSVYLARHLRLEPLVILYDAICNFYQSIGNYDLSGAKACWHRINLMTPYFPNASRYSVLVFIECVESSLTNYPALHVLAELSDRPDIFTRPFLQQMCQLNGVDDIPVCQLFFPMPMRHSSPPCKKRREERMMSYIN